MPCGIVIFLPLAKVILYSPLTARRAISLRRSLNITAKQYHSPKANITKKLFEKISKSFFGYFELNGTNEIRLKTEDFTLNLTKQCRKLQI